MINSHVQKIALFPAVALKPVKSFLTWDQNRRQRDALRKLDQRELRDIGMSEAQRDAALRNWSNH